MSKPPRTHRSHGPILPWHVFAWAIAMWAVVSCTGVSVVGPRDATDATTRDDPRDVGVDLGVEVIADAVTDTFDVQVAFDGGLDVTTLDVVDVGADAFDGGDIVDVPDVVVDVHVVDVPDVAVDVRGDVTPHDVLLCPAGELACDGRCVDPQWDLVHCGMCGMRCPAGMACSLGRCASTCAPPRALCTEGGLARCVELMTDPTHCGACGRTCSDGQSCVAGRCTCGAGRTQCSTRCADLESDPGSCGGCSVVCPSVLNGRAVCRRGACSFACAEGFHTCGSQCVDDRSPLSCGVLCTPCPTAANASPTCDGRVCGLQCIPGFHLCSGVCVNNAAVATCGTACTPCPAPANGVATCNAISCGFACSAGFHACDTRCVANTAITSCGMSCEPCPTLPNSTATCNGTTCGFTCMVGFADCDRDASNGCEVDLRATPAHCGACGRACAMVANARATCVSSVCGYACDMGTADCDRNPTNGCETDTRSNGSHCGVCGRVCATGEVCSAGACRVPRLGWSRRFGGDGDDEALAVAGTAAGDSIVVGRFRSMARFGSMSLTSEGGDDIFVLSATSDGTVRWAQRFGGMGHDIAYGVALDAEENIYVSGSFRDTVTLGDTTLVSMGDNDVLLLSLTSAGALRWARRYGGVGADVANGIAADANGPIITGTFRGEVDFGGGVLAGTAAAADAFVVALSREGAHRWSRRFGATAPRTGGASGYGVAIGADGTVAVTGFFQGSVDFGSDLHVSAGNFDFFVVSLTAMGAQRWSRRAGAASVDWGQAVAIDAANNVYATGYYQGTVDFGGGVLTAPSGTDAFLVSYTSMGAHRWSRRFGGGPGYFGTATALSLAIDATGNPVFGGFFAGNVDFGGGLRTSAGRSDAFLVSYTNLGAHRWSRRFGGIDDDAIQGVGVDLLGNVLAAGSFYTAADFGAGTLASVGGSDVFAILYEQ